MFMTKCPACGLWFEHISTIHIKTHGNYTRQEFYAKYGEPERPRDIHPVPKVQRWIKENMNLQEPQGNSLYQAT